ncbi:type II toxin-antitoxin system YoeB family toxin [Streptomyces sp. NBC_00696]
MPDVNFTPVLWADFQHRLGTDRKTVHRVVRLMGEIQHDPFDGIRISNRGPASWPSWATAARYHRRPPGLLRRSGSLGLPLGQRHPRRKTTTGRQQTP